MSRKKYAKKAGVLDDFLKRYVEDARVLVDEGFSYAGDQWRIAFIGSLGDWAWHHKAGHLTRSFYCVAKSARAREPTTGICHECPAGMAGYPWEDMALHAPFADVIPPNAWLLPGVLLSLVCYSACRGKMYRWDAWHGLHLGIGHEFLGSAYVEALPLYPGSSIEARVETMESDVHQWLQKTGQPEALSFSDINRKKLSWSAEKEWPRFLYQKGTDWVALCRYLIQFLQKHKAGLNPCQSDVLSACECIDYAMSAMYDWGVWIPAEHADKISRAGLGFLQLYQKMAHNAIATNKTRFTEQPKLHTLWHVFRKLYMQAQSGQWGYNPLCECVPPNEDFIGRVSRSSRRVSNRTVSMRTLQAHLIQVRRAWQNPYKQEDRWLVYIYSVPLRLRPPIGPQADAPIHSKDPCGVHVHMRSRSVWHPGA